MAFNDINGSYSILGVSAVNSHFKRVIEYDEPISITVIRRTPVKILLRLRLACQHLAQKTTTRFLALFVCILVAKQTFGQTRVPDHKNIAQLIAQGEALAAQGRLAEAEIPFEQAETLDPTNIEALVELAKVKGRIGRYTEAADLFQKVVRLAPKIAEDHLNLAIALADLGDLAGALREAVKASQLEPRSASAHLNSARILDDLHRTAEARTEFEKAFRIAPDNPDTLFYWALLEREDVNHVKETELLQRLIRLQPKNAKAFFYLGRSLSDQSNDAAAIDAFRKALQIDPDLSQALYRLSRLLRLSDPAESEDLSKRFQATRRISEHLDEIKILGNKAYAASIRQDWPQAISLLEEALDSCGDCEVAASLHKNLGLALCRSGNLSEGENELKIALQLNPDDPDVVTALGVIAKRK